MRILITGCMGYIGSALCEELTKKYEVTGVDMLYYKEQHNASLLKLINKNNFTFCWENLGQKNLLDKHPEWLEHDIFIFLHALVGAPLCARCPNQAYHYNFRSIKEFVEKLDSNQKVLYPNSNSAYGTAGEAICTELTSVNPISVYSRSKMMTETFLLNNHKNSTILRLATVFGTSTRPRFDLLVNDWAAEAYYNSRLEIFECNARRNFVHINDVVRAFIWCINPNIIGLYNVGLDSANCTKLELAKRINNIVGCDIIEKDGEDPDKRDYIVSSQKFMDTGFEFKHSLEQGITEVVNLCQYFTKGEIDKMGNYVG
jgi:nucleoside-diphosphate-sugar epimerase